MKQMKSVGKRILIAVLVVVLIGGAAYGGVYAFQHFRKGSTVYVYAMDELIITDEWIGAEEESYGNVYTDNIQTAYVSSTQNVTEILVEEGQEVKKGDVLFSYDTTLSQMNLERQKIQIQKLEKELEEQKKELQVIQTYRAGQKVKYSDLPEDSTLLGNAEEPPAYTASAAGFSLLSAVMSQVIEGVDGTETEESGSAEETSPSVFESFAESFETPSEEVPETSSAAQTDSVTESEEQNTQPESSAQETEGTIDGAERAYPLLLGGTGTEADPYIYCWIQEYQMDDGFVRYVLNGQEEAYVLFGVYMNQENSEDPGESGSGEAIPDTDPSHTETEGTDASFTWLMHFQKDGTYQYLKVSIGQSIYDVLNRDPDDGAEDGTDDWFDDWFEDGSFEDSWGEDYDTVTLTAEEIARMTTQKEQEIRSTELSLRSAKLEYDKMEAEINDNKVVSTIDGTVVALNDLETARDKDEPLVKVSAGGGYYVQGSVGEFKLDEIQIGQKVQIMSYETGITCTGEITAISQYPSSDMYYYFSGNTNVSYYPYTVLIEDAADLKIGEGVSMMLESTAQEESGFYLDNMFIRTEKGESYVYVQAEDGTLHKQAVRTGKSLRGSYTQILSGLSMDMNIAFPYGSSVVEGAGTEVKSLDYLYEY